MASSEKSSPWVRALKKFKIDGWTNILTNLGVFGKDKRTGARVKFEFLTRQEADDLYGGDDIAERIVDRPAEEMMREGWKTTAEGEGELTENLQEEFKRFDLYKKLEQAIKWARQYGGAGIIVGLKDGQTPDQPVDLGRIQEVEYFTVLDCHRLVPFDSSVDLDVRSANFGKPLFYKVENMTVGGGTLTGLENVQGEVKIHWTRVIRFEGREVPWQQKPTLKWWGNSILAKLQNPIRNYQNANDSAAAIFSDFTQMVFKMKNLADLIAQGDDKLVTERLQLIAKTSSIINALVIEEGEEIERKSTSITGLPELLKMINARLVAATDLPHTILLGESPSGLGATGDSEMKDFYAHIKNKQESELCQQISQITLFFLSSKSGPTKGKVPPKWSIEFNPLWQPSEKEVVETRKIQSETDKNYYDMQALDADEIAESRWGSGKYSFETTLNTKVRKAISAPPGDPNADPNAEATTSNDNPPDAEENKVTSPQVALTGVQVTSMLDIIGQVGEGKIPRETGVTLLEVAFALSNEKAEEIMGPVGNGFEPKQADPVVQANAGAVPPGQKNVPNDPTKNSGEPS